MLSKQDLDSVRNACKSDRKTALRNGSRNLHNHERSTRVTSADDRMYPFATSIGALTTRAIKITSLLLYYCSTTAQSSRNRSK